LESGGLVQEGVILLRPKATGCCLPVLALGNRPVGQGSHLFSRKETEAWLAKHNVEVDFLRMRAHGDFTHDDKLKKTWLEGEIYDGYEVMCAFDDRDKVVKMWRENGVACFQVAEGDF
jgi:hypothetical protein